VAASANYALFLTEFTEVLGLEKPLPATDSGQNDHYRLERPVTSAAIGETSKKFIDFYRRGSFILETKQGSQPKVPDDGQPALAAVPAVRRLGHGVRGTRAWDKSMVKARGQADNYARSIAREDGWRPSSSSVTWAMCSRYTRTSPGRGTAITNSPMAPAIAFSLTTSPTRTCSNCFATYGTTRTRSTRPDKAPG